MESILKLSNLSEVKPYKSAWSVAVKVIHTWVSFSHQFGASLEMVLADKHGVKIHAICKQPLMQKFEKLIGVGEWKVITNFALRPACGTNRPTNNLFRIEFMNHTLVANYNFQNGDDMFLNLHAFGPILNGSHDIHFLIDVIGVISDFGGHEIGQPVRKEVFKLEFTLEDINNTRLQCCLSGRLADLIIEEVKPKNGDVCLIRFGKIGKYNDEWRVSNAFHCTEVFINPNIKEAESLKQKIGVDNTTTEKEIQNIDKIPIQEKRLRWSQFPFVSIQEMKRSNQAGCRVVCSVYAVDTSDGWWYCACGVCENKVSKPLIVFAETDVAIWWCEFCHKNVTNVSPRYKLDLLVQDQTGESKFTLLDSVVKSVLNKSASKIVDVSIDKIDDQDMLTSDIVDMVGKSYGFGILFDENNNFQATTTFKAKKVWGLHDAIWKTTKWLHKSSVCPRKKQCTDVKRVDESG